MPTEQKLNEILTEKQREINQAIETLKTYNKEIEATVNKLRASRAELNDQAKKRVEDLQASIPSLASAIIEKQAKIAELDKFIDDKQKKANAELESAKAHYKNLEGLLLKEYSEKHAKLDARDIAQNKRDDEYLARNSALMVRETSLDDNNQKLYRDQEALERANKDLLKTQDTHNAKVTKEEQIIKDQNALLESERTAIASIKEDLSSQIKLAQDRQKAADVTLARIGEVEARELAAAIKEDATSKRAEDLNQLSVKVMADNKKLSKREEGLNEREQKLNERESNIKFLEANIAGK